MVSRIVDPCEYEIFVRLAFSIEKDVLIDRCADPGGLAHQSFYNEDNLPHVKIAVGYAIATFNNYLHNKTGITEKLSRKQINRMSGMLDELITAPSLNEISSLIEEYKTYQEICYSFPWQRED